ncbi:MAG: HAD family hydrolase [Thermoplasmatales archaeon]|nr:HAD family hydrolase [Thermoplasmatales archaeon]
MIVSFDLDGTLVDYSYADSVWCEGVPKIYADEKKISFDEAKKYVMKEYMKVGERKIEWYNINYWFAHFGLKTDWRFLLKKYENRINVYPEVKNVLSELSKKHRLIISSNAASEFVDVMAKKIGNFFEHTFSSTSDFKLVKKTPEFYLRLLESLKIQKEDIIHVGDHYEFDYLVPKSIGIKSFYVDRNSTRKGKDVIKDLNGLMGEL